VEDVVPPVFPRLVVTKVANPVAVPVSDLPTTVGYLVRIFNPTSSTLRITSATDDIYDILADDPSKLPVSPALDCAIPFELAAGASRVCAFTTPLDGNVGDVITDVVTVTACALPECTETATASDDASVTITANPVALRVLKTANPTSVLAPGEEVTFSVEVINVSSTAEITLNEMQDDIYGDITQVSGDITGTTCLVPQTLAPGDSYDCAFTAQVSGTAGSRFVDIVTVTGAGPDDLPVANADIATVQIVGELPRVQLVKSANPQSVNSPGGTVTFTAQVQNTSATESLRVTSLVDDIYGDITQVSGDITGTTCAVPQVLAPGGGQLRLRVHRPGQQRQRRPPTGYHHPGRHRRERRPRG
jgi:hypothetical protein